MSSPLTLGRLAGGGPFAPPAGRSAPQSVLVNRFEEPIPPSDIVRRLKQIDPHLGLRYYNDSRQEGYHWAVTWDWPANDRRREWIQQGQTPPDRAFDILTFLPSDCDPNDAYGFVVRSMRVASTPEIRKCLEWVARYNDDVTAAQDRQVTDPAMQHAEDLAAHHYGRHPGADFDGTDNTDAIASAAVASNMAAELDALRRENAALKQDAAQQKRAASATGGRPAVPPPKRRPRPQPPKKAPSGGMVPPSAPPSTG